jgi:hypothetical protein
MKNSDPGLGTGKGWPDVTNSHHTAPEVKILVELEHTNVLDWALTYLPKDFPRTVV